MALSPEQQLELQTQLQRAVIECNERCLYFASKWYALIQISRDESHAILTESGQPSS